VYWRESEHERLEQDHRAERADERSGDGIPTRACAKASGSTSRRTIHTIAPTAKPRPTGPSDANVSTKRCRNCEQRQSAEARRKRGDQRGKEDGERGHS
jgi:hypothetical protein